MNVGIDWDALGMVCLVSFGAAVGLIVLFALGVGALATPVTAEEQARPRWAWPVGMICLLACALGVAYGLYLIIVK